MGKPKSPRFVVAQLLKDGTVKLIDDDDEEYHVEMRHDQSWPMISRRVRNFEMREAHEKHNKPQAPTPPFGPPRLVFDDAS